MKLDRTTLTAWLSRTGAQSVVPRRGRQPMHDWHLAVAVSAAISMLLCGVGVYVFTVVAVHSEDAATQNTKPFDEAGLTRTLEAYRARHATFEELRQEAAIPTATTSSRAVTGASTTSATDMALQ